MKVLIKQKKCEKVKIKLKLNKNLKIKREELRKN